MESGERKLNSLEPTRIANVLKLPLDWFLTPPLPAVVSRRASRQPTDESKADALLERLAQDVKLVIDLGLLVPPASPKPLSIVSVERAEASAGDLRRQMELPPGPIWDLLTAAERVGLYGFCLDLGNDSLDGSYLRFDTGGVAVVNGAMPSGRRRFTFVHEPGHHVFADEYSDEWIVDTGGDERERLINAFVIHFLMPRGSVSSRWQELEGSREPRQAAVGLGAEYGIGWTAVPGHLRHLPLIGGRMHEQLSKERPTKADYLDSGITLREELMPPAVAPRSAQAVVRAFKRHKIGRNRTLDLLHGTVSAEDLPLEDRIPVESMRAQFALD